MAIRLHVERGFVRDVDNGISNDLEFKHDSSLGGQTDFIGGQRLELGFEAFGNCRVTIRGHQLDKLADGLRVMDGEIFRPAPVVRSGYFDVVSGFDQGDIVRRKRNVRGIAEGGGTENGDEEEEGDFHKIRLAISNRLIPQQSRHGFALADDAMLFALDQDFRGTRARIVIRGHDETVGSGAEQRELIARLQCG
jgi:hypothetical protein